MRALVAFVLGLVLAPPLTAQPISVLDDSGHTITLAKPPQRVITLGPHLAEQAFALGAGAQVVGVSRFSDYPERSLRQALAPTP